MTITVLASAVTMPTAGRLADLHGKRPVLQAAAAAVVVGSLLCAVSSTLAPLLVGPARQGTGIAFIPIGIALLREIVPPDRAAGSVSAMSATMGVGGALGLPLAAWLVAVADWHALFWSSAALAGVVLVLVCTTVPPVRDARGGRLDVAGAAGLAAGLGAVLLALTKATTWGWTDPRTIGAATAGAIVLLTWAAYELRHDAPVVDLRTVGRRPVLLTDLAAVTVGFGMMAQSVVVPQLLQLPVSTGHGLGLPLLEAALWMAPGGLAMLALTAGSAVSVNSPCRALGMTTAAAVMGTVLSAGARPLGVPSEAAFTLCFALGAIAATVAVAVTAALPARPRALLPPSPEEAP